MFKLLLRLILTLAIFGYLYKKFSKKKNLKLEQNTQQIKDEQN